MKNSIQPPTSVLTQLRQKMVGCPELLRDDLRHLVEPLEARIAPALTLSGLAADAVSEFPLPPFDVLDETLGTIPGITTGSQPPDTVMDVGLNHVIQIVNSTNYQVWDKQIGRASCRERVCMLV